MRRRPDSSRPVGIADLSLSHLGTSPFHKKKERETGLEPATPTLVPTGRDALPTEHGRNIINKLFAHAALCVKIKDQPLNSVSLLLQKKRARDGTRTRDPNLGKVVLYQLSYSRLLNKNLSSLKTVILFSKNPTLIPTGQAFLLTEPHSVALIF